MLKLKSCDTFSWCAQSRANLVEGVYSLVPISWSHNFPCIASHEGDHCVVTASTFLDVNSCMSIVLWWIIKLTQICASTIIVVTIYTSKHSFFRGWLAQDVHTPAASLPMCSSFFKQWLWDWLKRSKNSSDQSIPKNAFNEQTSLCWSS